MPGPTAREEDMRDMTPRPASLRTATEPRPPEASGFYRKISESDDWHQGDVFRASAGSIDRPELLGIEDGSTEGGLFALLRVVNGTEELWADGDGAGLVMLVSHTCDFSAKYRSDGRRGQPLLVAPIVPLALFLGDRNAEIAWLFGWEGGMKHVLALPPAPPHFYDRAAVLLRFITAMQPESLNQPVLGLSLRERRRLRQQLARFFARLEEPLDVLAASENRTYGDATSQP